MTEVQCYNKGCLQKFNPAENHEKACVYHPGEPVFHDVYKSWSCCKKKTTDFTVFLSTKGCTTGLHNPEKPIEPAKAKETDVCNQNATVIITAPKPVQSAPRLPRDHPRRRLTIVVAPSLKSHLINAPAVPEEQMNGLTMESEIPVGTECMRPGCTKTYDRTLDLNDPCWFHSGTAIFHEGMKYWSCCQRKTSDFDAFLQQAGCTSGSHYFVKEKLDDQTVTRSTRYDWHQTADSVYVTIYSKLPSPTESWIECNDVNLNAHVEYDDGRSLFELDIPLWGAIDVESSQVTMTAAKVEVRMKKRGKISWPKLIFYAQSTPQAETES